MGQCTSLIAAFPFTGCRLFLFDPFAFAPSSPRPLFLRFLNTTLFYSTLIDLAWWLFLFVWLLLAEPELTVADIDTIANALEGLSLKDGKPWKVIP